MLMILYRFLKYHYNIILVDFICTLFKFLKHKCIFYMKFLELFKASNLLFHNIILLPAFFCFFTFLSFDLVVVCSQSSFHLCFIVIFNKHNKYVIVINDNDNIMLLEISYPAIRSKCVEINKGV